MDKAFKIAVMLSAYDKLSTVVNSAVDKSERKLKGFQKTANGFANKFERGMILGEGGVQFFRSAVTAAEESEVAGNRLRQVFKSMGEQNDNAAAKAQEYASQLQLQIGIEDELINATQAKIATFKSVSNETARMAGIFDRATAAAFDMQATGFGEASQNAVQLGKALEDPVKGITALRKSGITFTEAERKKIQTLVDGNKKLQAQKLILAAIEKQVGGVAKATATSTSKQNVGWSEAMETLGKQVLPIYNQFVSFISNSVIPTFVKFIEKNPMLVKVLGAVSVALLAVGSAARIVSFIMMTNPIVLIITAIATAAFLIYKNWDKIKAWFQNLWDGVKNVFNKFWQWVKGLFLKYTPAGLIYSNWGKITGWFSNLWNNVKKVFSTVWKWIKAFLWDYNPFVILYKHWDNLPQYFSEIWENVKGIFNQVWQWIKDKAVEMYNAGKELLKSLWQGIKDGFSNAFSFDASGQAKKMVDGLKDQIKQNPLQFDAYMQKARAAGFEPNEAALRNELNIPATPSAVNSKSTYQFAPVINYSGPGGPAAGQQIGNDVVKQMQQWQANKLRTQF